MRSSSNPVFTRSETFAGSRGGYADFSTPSAGTLDSMYGAPSATPTQMRRLTLDDVIMKTGILFAILLVGAAAGWAVPALALPGMVVALVLGLVISFKQSTNPALIMAYAAFEGLFVGGVSTIYSRYAADGSNVVGQAVIGTLAAFASMLVLYRTGVIKATPKFTKMMMVALGGYLIVALVSFVAGAIFHVGGGLGFYGTGGLGLLLCAAGVALASFSLILDFDYIERAVRDGAPERTSWLAGFGLMVTLVWLYLELLRLLSILQSRD